jgi:hypothetical protein
MHSVPSQDSVDVFGTVQDDKARGRNVSPGGHARLGEVGYWVTRFQVELHRK